MTGAAEGEGCPADGGWRPASLPPDLTERLAAVAVHVAHEAADMLAVAAPLPIPEWSVEMYGSELQREMDVVLFEWPNISDAQLQQIRQINTPPSSGGWLNSYRMRTLEALHDRGRKTCGGHIVATRHNSAFD